LCKVADEISGLSTRGAIAHFSSEDARRGCEGMNNLEMCLENDFKSFPFLGPARRYQELPRREYKFGLNWMTKH
jgi:hypothetical protein